MGKATNSGRRSSKRIAATARQTTALQYRLQGASFHDIAVHMQISKQRVMQLVAAAMREREASFFETLEAVRHMELLRLDRMMADHFPRQAVDIEAANLVLAIMDRRSRYLGLDAPHESRMSSLPPHDAPEVDLTLLSVEELQTWRALLMKVTKRPKVEQPPAIEHQPSGIAIALPPP